MKTQFYDLSIDTLDDGTIRLEQRDYCGEAVILDLHPVQAAFIANGLPANSVPERIATLERRLLWMRDRFEECHVALPSDFYERCPEAPEFSSWLQASVDVATEFCADFPDASSNALASTLEAPSLPPGDGSLLSIAGCAAGHPEHRNTDLFSNATGKD